MSTRTPPSSVISTDDIEGTLVYDQRGENSAASIISTLTRSPAVSPPLSSVVAGFFGIGHSHREVPWQALTYSPKLHGYSLGTDN